MKHSLSDAKKEVVVASRLKKARELRDKVQQRLGKLEEKLKSLNAKIRQWIMITEFFHGKPLHIWCMSEDSVCINEITKNGNGRSAEVYRNAHHPKKKLWGLRLDEPRNVTGYMPQKYYGANWPNYHVCVQMAKEWVALGKKPTRKS